MEMDEHISRLQPSRDSGKQLTLFPANDKSVGSLRTVLPKNGFKGKDSWGERVEKRTRT